MKKQLLIAAVAATMSATAMADISISGNMKVNYTNSDTNSGATVSNAIDHELNLAITGKTGGTTVYAEVALDNDTVTTAGSAPMIEDAWVSTSIGGVGVKVGQWNGSDSILTADSARTENAEADKYSITGSVSNVDITFEGTGGSSTVMNGSTSTKLATTIGGVAVSYKNESHQDQFTAAGSIQGLNYNFHHVNADAAASDKTSTELSYDMNGVTLSYANANADASATITGDAYFGDATTFAAAGDDIQGFGIATPVSGNTVTFKHIKMDDATAGADDTSINKLVVNRPLANGTTFELTYTDKDATGTSNDVESVDLELAVKF